MTPQERERLEEYYSRCAICNKKWDAHEGEPVAMRVFFGIFSLGLSEVAMGPEVRHKFVERRRPDER